jgi:hypothetical protein
MLPQVALSAVIGIGSITCLTNSTSQRLTTHSKTIAHVRQDVLTSSILIERARGWIVRHRVLFTEWSKVALCEEGGNWASYGYSYPDALGIDRTNYHYYGGNVHHINSIPAQISVAQTLVRTLHIAIPDQYGCHQW